MATVKQGDSLWIDYEVPNFKAIDSTWANWTGLYEISVTESSTVLLSGSLTRSSTEGIFQLRLNTSNATWVALSAGTYKLMIEISNSSQGYREEKHEKLVVKTQGIS